MPRFSYGSVLQARTKRLLEALFDFVNYEYVPDENEFIDLNWRWKENQSAGYYLVVQTTTNTLQMLTRRDVYKGELTKSQITEILFHYLENFLEILDDNRASKRGSNKLNFTLKLWSKNKSVNLLKIEKKWKYQSDKWRKSTVKTTKPQDLSMLWNANSQYAEKRNLELEEFTSTNHASLKLAVAFGIINPLKEFTSMGLAFSKLAKKVIEFFAKQWNKTLVFEEVVAIAASLAYLKSFDSWIKRNSILTAKIDQEQNQELKVDSKLENLTLDRGLATNALDNFHESELAQIFNQILSSQLLELGLSEIEVEIIVDWVAWDGGRYLKEAIAEYSNSQELGIIGIYKNASQEEDSNPYKSIETYLEEQIETKPKEKVFNEEFSFEDIYIPLKAVPVDANGKVSQDKTSFIVVEDWAREMLLNPLKAKQVMFIQGGPGRGKSVFCRMFADFVRREIHPLWIPVLIRLRDIESFEQSFAKTLQGAVKADFAKDDGWLTDSKLRFLFLLDGFDELRMEGRAKGGVERFINQVGSYQKLCDTSEMGHRFIITGRQLALQGISYLSENLERVELLEMDDDLQQQWFIKWQQVVDQNEVTANRKIELLKGFLQSRHLPHEVKEELAREPLLLYLLAAMHRDGKITVADLEGTSGIQTKITIYEQALNWVLTQQRRPIQKEIVKLKEEELSQVLLETGLSVVQSGGECSKIKTVEERLFKSKPKIAEKIKDIRTKQNDKVLKNALAAFYLKPASDDEEGAVEFFHKSFGEFLCAKRMQQSVERWTGWDADEEEFYVDKKQLAEEIYDLLGYGGLTSEIVEYLFGLLKVSNKFAPVRLFNRLEDFYKRWCDGKFIDAPPDNNYPQQKMQLLKEQQPITIDKKDNLGLRQVDVYTGLNVMILLLELHRYGQQQEELKSVINFHPCGKLDQTEKLEDDTRLFNTIGYSRCLSNFGFLNTVGRFLSNANLKNADLRNAHLSDADLSEANLSNVELSNADLSDAKLSNADLKNADLSDAKLSNADLRNTKLRLADLSKADLRNADLRNADLSNANLSEANLSNANLSKADLSNANLSDADLRYTNLSNANLSDADLSNADFIAADLSDADLNNADLSDAKLISANIGNAKLDNVDLRYADLSNASLDNVDLRYADLNKANLDNVELRYADLSNSNLKDIRWDENTNWSNVRGLDLAINVPEELKQQFLQ